MKVEKFHFTDIIWKFHLDSKLEQLYFSLRRSDGSFYLQHLDQIWELPCPQQYIGQVLSIWNTFIVVQFFHREQLHKISFFAVYQFGKTEPEWTNTEDSIEDVQGPYLRLLSKLESRYNKRTRLIQGGGIVDLDPTQLKDIPQWIPAEVSEDRHQIDLANYQIVFDKDFKLKIASGNTVLAEEFVTMEDQEWNHVHDYIIAFGSDNLLLLTGKNSCSHYKFR